VLKSPESHEIHEQTAASPGNSFGAEGGVVCESLGMELDLLLGETPWFKKEVE